MTTRNPRPRKVSRAAIERAIGVLGALTQTDIPSGRQRDEIASVIELLDGLSYGEGGFTVPVGPEVQS